MSERLTEGDKKLLSDIEEYGWHVLKILAEGEEPGFCYSVGLYNSFKHPEIVIIGLRPELAHVLVNNIGEDIKNGLKLESGKFYSNILDNFDCLMINVDKDKYEEYFGYGLWYYRDTHFPVLQCIYPTIKGIYPWEDNWPKDIKSLQPLLGNVDIKN